MRDEVDFFDALANEFARFLDDVVLLAAAMGAAHAGDDAETAGMIAPFGDLYVCEVVWGKSKARRGVIGNVNRSLRDIEERGDGLQLVVVVVRFGFIDDCELIDDLLFAGDRFRGGFASEAFGAMRDSLIDDVIYALDLIDAHEGVDFGKQVRKFFTETLRQTTGDDEALATILSLANFVGFENRVDAFLLRGIDERAGVHDDDVRSGCVIGDLHAAFDEGAEHDFGVDQVFGATERDQPDLDRLRFRFVCVWRTHEKRKPMTRNGVDARNGGVICKNIPRGANR